MILAAMAKQANANAQDGGFNLGSLSLALESFLAPGKDVQAAIQAAGGTQALRFVIVPPGQSEQLISFLYQLFSKISHCPPGHCIALSNGPTEMLEAPAGIYVLMVCGGGEVEMGLDF